MAMEANQPNTRRVIWQLLGKETRNQSMQYLNEDVRAKFLEAMDTAQLVAVAENLDTDDFADILQQLPATKTTEVLENLDTRDRARVESVLSYPEYSAGGLMNTDTITVRPRHAIELVLRYLRLTKDLPKSTDSLIVVNSADEYVGMLPLAKLLTSNPQ